MASMELASLASMASMESIFRDVLHGYDLSVWLRMRDGACVPGGNAMFRQNKPVYVRLCELLGLPSSGSKVETMTRVREYVFTPEQVEEMKAFLKREKDAKLFERRLAALEARPRPHDYRTFCLLRFHGRS